MKQLHEFDTEDVRRLVEDEGWHEPLPDVRRVQLTSRQQAVFWGLRLYVVVMTAVVVWAFLHGAAG
ncbi:MAG: hypothetical protein K2Y02_04960 [Burkholderiaceae bacterium]|nr:hypothetical protein [Burkholderiaceae bacterium]MBX9793632.1 hypothetical protein [Burkholderiaceae bacterium]